MIDNVTTRMPHWTGDWEKRRSKSIRKTTSGTVIWPFAIYYKRITFDVLSMASNETITEKEYMFLKLQGKA